MPRQSAFHAGLVFDAHAFRPGALITLVSPNGWLNVIPSGMTDHAAESRCYSHADRDFRSYIPRPKRAIRPPASAGAAAITIATAVPVTLCSDYVLSRSKSRPRRSASAVAVAAAVFGVKRGIYDQLCRAYKRRPVRMLNGTGHIECRERGRA